jgi:hypothetical protein
MMNRTGLYPGHRVEGLAGGRHEFVEYSIRGIRKKQRRIVVQKGADKSHPFYGIWYIYDVTPELITTVGWSCDKEHACIKARRYIRTGDTYA